MSPSNTQARTAAAEGAITGPVIGGDALVAYEAMLADVPEAGQQGYDRILASLAGATSLEDLDAPWRSRGGEQFLGQRLVIHGISKMPSDFRGGLPWFLVVDAELSDGGGDATFTSGSVNVVAQLVRAHALGLFPVEAVLVESDRPTAAGYTVQHLVFPKD